MGMEGGLYPARRGQIIAFNAKEKAQKVAAAAVKRQGKGNDYGETQKNAGGINDGGGQEVVDDVGLNAVFKLEHSKAADEGVEDKREGKRPEDDAAHERQRAVDG